jgi:hypothetical protein
VFSTAAQVWVIVYRGIPRKLALITAMLGTAATSAAMPRKATRRKVVDDEGQNKTVLH